MWLMTCVATMMCLLVAIQGSLFEWRPAQTRNLRKTEVERIVSFLFAASNYANGLATAGSDTILTSQALRSADRIAPGAVNGLDPEWKFVRLASGDWGACITASEYALSQVVAESVPFSGSSATFKITRHNPNSPPLAVMSVSGANQTTLTALEPLCL